MIGLRPSEREMELYLRLFYYEEEGMNTKRSTTLLVNTQLISISYSTINTAEQETAHISGVKADNKQFHCLIELL